MRFLVTRFVVSAVVRELIGAGHRSKRRV